MDGQLVRVLIDIELISCLAVASGVLVGASLYDLKKIRHGNKKLGKLGGRRVKLATWPRSTYSLRGCKRELELVITQQAEKTTALLPRRLVIIEKFIKIYYKLLIIGLPLMLAYISYAAIRFRFTFLMVVAWASLFGFMALATMTSEKLSSGRKLRLIALEPVAYWPFMLLSLVWALKIVRDSVIFIFKLISRLRLAAAQPVGKPGDVGPIA